MKKFLFVLCIAAATFTGCQKDTSNVVKIGTIDLATINGQLKGLWLFPQDEQKIVDVSGSSLTDPSYTAAPAMQFDGGSKVTIFKDVNTTLKGTYTLSTTKGYIYLDVIYPDKTDINYQLAFIDSQTLKLISSEPYVYYAGNDPVSASQLSNVILQKQNAADVTGKLIKVFVNGSTPYDVSVYVSHTRLEAVADTLILMDTKTGITGSYDFSFPTQSGDKLTLDINGDYTKVSFFAYYNGVPMTGNTAYLFQEIKTTTGWTTP
ncbi:MAG: hypothetical protein ACHQHN_15125 [Sphingobacteriales bacterium]